MPDRLENIFSECKSEVVRLHYRWNMYRQVYATNSHRVEVLNRTAANFLSEVQSLNIDGMLLGLSKLTDPAKQRRFENLTLELLINELEANGYQDSATDANRKLDQLRDVSETFRNLRNKRIAHSDLKSNPTFNDQALPGVSRENIEHTLTLVREIMNIAESAMYEANTAYEDVIMPAGSDGRALVIWLQKGLAYEQLVDSGEVDRRHWKSIGDVDA